MVLSTAATKEKVSKVTTQGKEMAVMLPWSKVTTWEEIMGLSFFQGKVAASPAASLRVVPLRFAKQKDAYMATMVHLHKSMYLGVDAMKAGYHKGPVESRDQLLASHVVVQ